MTVGDRIKILRNNLGMSQVSFADRINVSKQTLYKYENNIITNIPSDKIEAAAQLGKVSPAYLMGWEQLNEGEAPTNTIKKIPSKQEELISVYDQLSSGNQDKVLTYSKSLLSTQQMEDELLAAHARTDIEHTPEGQQHDIDLMNDDSKWEE